MRPERDRMLALTEYWRDISISRALGTVAAPAINAAQPMYREDTEATSEWVIPYDLNQFFSGQAPEPLVHQLRSQWEDKHKRPINDEKQPPVFVVHCAPFGIDAPNADEPLYPIIAMVGVLPSGALCLRPEQADFPPALWIPRRFFGSENDAIPRALQFRSFGQYVDMLFNAGAPMSWSGVIQLFAASWSAAAGTDFNSWLATLPVDCQYVDGWMRSGPCEAFASNILWAYSEIARRIDYSGAPPLYERLLSGKRGSVPPSSTTKHVAVLDGTHGLLERQRAAINALVESRDGDVVAVNGPPGTGKTTLIQSAVANVAVRMTVEHDRPALAFGAAATNQAITNILESFSRAQAPFEHALFTRWLEGLHSYGLYAKAVRRKKKIWAFPMLTYTQYDLAAISPEHDEAFYRSWTGRYDFDAVAFPAILRELVHGWTRSGEEIPIAAVILLARLNGPDYWLRAFRSAFPDDTAATIEEALDVLHQYLRGVISAKCAVSEAIDRGEPTALVAGLIASACSDVFGGDVPAWRPFVEEALQQEEYVRAADETRDALHAAAEALLGSLAFALSSRIGEGRFVAEIASGKAFRYLDRALHDEEILFLANVTPCIVATFDRLPNVARKWNIRGSRWQLTFELADLLIIDEAGQAAPDKAAYAFALARRALIVGDTKQLPPVDEQDAPYFDEVIAGYRGVRNRENTERGLLCTAPPTPRDAPSIMFAAANVASFDEGLRLGPGLWLFDHFRCEPEIIEFCSRNWYGGRLTPRTTRRAKRDLYPVVYVPVLGNDRSAGGSRANDIEADAVAEWLICYQQYIEEQCGIPLHDAVGIITPFRAHAAAVRRSLRAYSTSVNADRLICDTVHSLQGAERDVVLLSLVYAPVDGAFYSSFLDRYDTLLNVAVSRARRSLVLFAHPNALRYARPGSATSRLRDHLIAHASCDDVDLRAPVISEPTALAVSG